MRASQYIKKVINIFGYRNKKGLEDLKRELSQIYDVRPEQVFLTLNGRSAIYLYLKSVGLQEGSKVAVPGFTCNAAVNPILWAGMKPVYFDVNEQDLSGDLSDVSDGSVDAVMVQHTFGLTSPALDRALEMEQRNGTIVFEDCAHVLSNKEFGRDNLLGQRSKAAIISFGLEKMLSTKIGGALILNDPVDIEKVEVEYKKLKEIPVYTIFLWLIHPIIWTIIRQMPFSVRPIIDVLESIGLLKLALPKAELKGVPARNNLGKMSGVIGEIAADEIRTELKSLIEHRAMLCEAYYEKLSPYFDHITEDYKSSLTRFPIISQDKAQRDEIFNLLKSMKVYFTTLYSPNIYPADVDLDKFHYKIGDCPRGESIAQRIINLPTGKNISVEYARMISDEIINKVIKR